MTPLAIGIIGKTGQLARALAELCETQGIEFTALGRDQLDLSADENTLQQALKAFHKVDFIINAAAYTAVDAAEDDIETALRVNANAPAIFAKYCKERGIPLIHISTDYVFNGQSTQPYNVDHSTAPLGVYGDTKLTGERAIQNIGGRFAILRTSWVYDGVGKNFMTTMLRLAETRDSLNVVNDQKGRPTYAPDLAVACLTAGKAILSDAKNSVGIFHVSNSGPIISWADFAEAIFKRAKPHLAHDMNVTGIPSAEYPTRAKRPAFSALDISKFEEVFHTNLPSWQSGLEQAISVWVDKRG